MKNYLKRLRVGYRPNGYPRVLPIVKAPLFFNIWSKINGFDVVGFTLPLIILSAISVDERPWVKSLINHEAIHIKQQLEIMTPVALLFAAVSFFVSIPLWVAIIATLLSFHVVYAVEYLWNRVVWNDNHFDAYVNISFEREAYMNEDVLDYLESRRLFAQWRD